jgi:serine protease
MRTFKGKPARPGGGGKNLFYHGGISDGTAGTIGVETAPKVYLVLWGSQWSNDPSNEKGILQSFLGKVFGSSWLNSVTQYCQGIASGSAACGSAGHAGNSNGVFAGTITDNGSAAPSSPSQSQLAAEAVKVAGQQGNTTASSNASTQYVIATAHGNNASGFGTSYCAWHSSTSSNYGDIAYTNLPYITDAGASCGANFNGLGANAGITIVEGHELAETITDQFPNGGWLDRNSSENGDKCAWTAGTSDQSLNGMTFPVQPLWSNASSSCVLSYP